MARQWLKCAISWSATVVREYRLSPAGPRIRACAAGCRFSTTTSTTRPGPSPRVSLRLSWASAGLAGRQWGLLLGPVLIILGHVAWLGSCAFAVVRAARKAPNNDLGRICSGSRFFRPPFARFVRRRLSSCSAQPPRSRRLFLAPCCCLLSPWTAPSRLPLARGRPGWLENLSILSKYQKGFEIAGAVTLIASGLYMLNAYYFWIPSLAI
jgi:cytochrome c-type biogenesis protein